MDSAKTGQAAVVEQVFVDQERPILSYGLPFITLCQNHVRNTFHATKVFIIISGTLARTTYTLEALQDAMPEICGTQVGMGQHTKIKECLELATKIQNLGTDLIITVGGGSIVDAAKIITYALANDADTREKILRLPQGGDNAWKAEDSTLPPKIPIMTVATSLAGAEYVPAAGVTDDIDGHKYQFYGKCRSPEVILLSSELALMQPLDKWLASGVRAVDHCVEALCTLLQPERLEDGKEGAIRGLKLLVQSLIQTKHHPEIAEYRLQSLLGARYAMWPLIYRVWKGASHGIGHFLGPMGVEHGVTSCILMRPTHKYNAKVNAKQQNVVLDILWDLSEARAVFAQQGLEQGKADLGDCLSALVAELGLPQSLTAVGITEETSIQALAKTALQDYYCETNPIPLRQPHQVLEILEMCR